MGKTKIVVVGNCQARPLAMAFEDLGVDVEVTGVAIVHLLNSDQLGEYQPKFEEADYIVAQLVADNYPCEFIRTKFLREQYGHKLVSIVNLYFSGYSPDWGYIKAPGVGPLKGPIGDYHNKVIYSCWKSGLTRNSAKSAYRNRSEFGFKNVAEASLHELAMRESGLDIKITDFISSEWKKEKLFHTFNHPSGSLLIEYSKRILERLDIELAANSYKDWNPLGKFELPSIVKVGAVQDQETCTVIQEGGKYSFSADDIVDQFYSLYDNSSHLVPNDFDFPEVSLRAKLFNYDEEAIDISDRPEHPRVNEIKLRQPSVFIEKHNSVKVNFGPTPKLLNKDESEDKEEVRLSRVLDLSTPGAVVYTHWLFDLLPKFKVVEDSGLSLGYFDYIVVNNKNTNFQKETLKKFGISESKLITFPSSKDRVFKCEEYFYVTPVRRNLSTPIWVLDFIKENFPPMPVEKVRAKKIYLSRRKANRRKIVNESEVSDYLKEKGFLILDCEDFSIGEISWIMSQAETVVGPHGAAMSNIAFCKPGTKVVELFSTHLSQEYWLLSKRCSLIYFSVNCRDGEGRKVNLPSLDYENNFFSINAEDMHVDIRSLDNIL